MRIRCKPWARPELEACPFFIAEPTANKGHWNEVFHNDKPLYIELGCGKGGFAAKAITHWPDVNYLAVDIKNEMLVLAKRKIEAALSEHGMTDAQVRIMIFNISHMEEAFPLFELFLLHRLPFLHSHHFLHFHQFLQSLAEEKAQEAPPDAPETAFAVQTLSERGSVVQDG